MFVYWRGVFCAKIIPMIFVRRNGDFQVRFFFLITFVTPVLHFISVTVVRVILVDKKDFNNFESYLEGSLCYDLEQCGKYRQLSLSPPKIFL
jgi:hypothetical protein